MKTLIFCFDGTWNGRDDAVPTNVLKLHRALDTPDQTSFFFAGPGNEDESGWFERVFGGAVGMGSFRIRDNAIDVLDSVYRPGMRIIVIGFSRGAAIARLFCSKINHPVSVLCCFDTVAAFLPFGRAQQGTLFHNMDVADNVIVAYHAVALDETRDPFIPNLMNDTDGIAEVWFAGNHADVGGSGDPELGAITLSWMEDNLNFWGLKTNLIWDAIPPIKAFAGKPVTDEGIFNSPRRVGAQENNEFVDTPVFLHTTVTPKYHDNLKGVDHEFV